MSRSIRIRLSTHTYTHTHHFNKEADCCQFTSNTHTHTYTHTTPPNTRTQLPIPYHTTIAATPFPCTQGHRKSPLKKMKHILYVLYSCLVMNYKLLNCSIRSSVCVHLLIYNEPGYRTQSFFKCCLQSVY